MWMAGLTGAVGGFCLAYQVPELGKQSCPLISRFTVLCHLTLILLHSLACLAYFGHIPLLAAAI